MIEDTYYFIHYLYIYSIIYIHYGVEICIFLINSIVLQNKKKIIILHIHNNVFLNTD